MNRFLPAAFVLMLTTTINLPARGEAKKVIPVIIACRDGMIGIDEDIARFQKLFDDYSRDDVIKKANLVVSPVVKIVYPQTRNRGNTETGPTQWEDIQFYFDKLEIDEHTSLVVLSRLHGETREDETHWLHLDQKSGDVEPASFERSRLLTLMTARKPKPRFAALITDSCSARIERAARRPEKAADAPLPSDLFLRLFAKPTGIVDLNSSSYKVNGKIVNELSWMDKNGGFFTSAFLNLLERGSDEEIRKRTDRINMNQPMNANVSPIWMGFINVLREDAQLSFRTKQQEYKGFRNTDPRFFDQGSQTVHVFQITAR